MPELPEVETIRRGLEKYLLGHKIIGVEVRNHKIFSGNSAELIGKKISAVKRYAKVISIDTSGGYSIVIHVKLTGQLLYDGPNLRDKRKISSKVIGGIPGPHTHVIFKLDRGGFLYYNDVRRFGWVKIMQTQNLKNAPEPFADLTAELFKKIIGASARPIKILLMDQSKIGGVGNIYANEALWLSKINPKRAANSITETESKRLFDAIIEVLGQGIKYGGASELAYVTPDGGEGKYQEHFLAYGQNGKLCPRCKQEKFVKIWMGGRGTYYCPKCQ